MCLYKTIHEDSINVVCFTVISAADLCLCFSYVRKSVFSHYSSYVNNFLYGRQIYQSSLIW